MKIQARIFDFLMVLVCVSLVAGCQQSQVQRLPAYLGSVPAINTSEPQIPESLPSALNTVGVLLVTDASFPNAAPTLSPEMVTILENRVVQKMDEFFGIPSVPVRPEEPLTPMADIGPFIQLAKAHGHDFMLVAVVSSMEGESHIELGAEGMMTRMPGVSIDNHALAELALLHADSGKVALHATGTGSSNMEQLVAPIGENYPRKEDARDILRGNAAQEALDHALFALQRHWGRSLVKGEPKAAG